MNPDETQVNGYKLTMENRMTKVETTLGEIKNNHLPHIEQKVDRLTWLTVTTLITLLVGIITALVRMGGL